MKKNHVFSSAILGVAMLLGSAACTKDAVNDAESDGRMTFASDVLSTKTTDLTVQATQIAAGVKVGVFVEGNYANSVLIADGQGDFTAQEEMYWPEEAVNIYAYAPYDAEWSDISSEVAFTVAADQSADEGYLASDLLAGAPETNPVSPTSEKVTLKFAHKLAKLNVMVVNNNEGIDLKGASLSVLNVLPTVSVDVKTGELSEAAGTAINVKMAAFAADATEFQASAVIVPQVVAAGNFVQIVTSDNRVLNAALKSDVTFAGNKKYTYTVKISGSGSEDVEVDLVLGSELSDWEDGNTDLEGDAEEVISYEVGDYVLADGTFLKAAEVATASDEVKANVAGVIFSTEVSETDAAAGYAGYAMSVWGRKGSQTWSSAPDQVLVGEGVSTTSAAFADLDGLAFASLVKAADPEYSYYTAFNFTNYSSQKKALTGANLSGWYVPALGQMALILNNLAGATIDLSADYELTGGGEYSAELADVAGALNSYVTAVNDASYADFSNSDQFFAAATERDATMIWGIKLTSTGYVIASKASKGNSGRNIIPVFAYKLPVE